MSALPKTPAVQESPSLPLVALVALALTLVCALLIGTGNLDDRALRDTYLSLRLVRLAASCVMGAGLAVAGVLVQGLFRNPLADPGIIGTTSGAVLGGKVVLVALEVLLGAAAIRGIAPDLLIPIGCMVGAGIALALLFVLTRNGSSVLLLLLIGFALSSLFASLGGLLSTLAQDSWELGRALVAFALGSVAGASMRHVLFALPLVVAGIVAAMRFATSLDLLLSGEEEAESLGLDVAHVRRWTAVWVAVLTGAAVSLGGFVGFVGLVVPHALRPYAGVEHRKLVPYAAVFGAVFVAASDVIARAIPGMSEMPLGVVTGLVGAPIFLRLLLRAHRTGGLDG